MRKDLFDILKKFNETNKEEINEEARRYVERSLIEGKQDGKFWNLNGILLLVKSTLHNTYYHALDKVYIWMKRQEIK